MKNICVVGLGSIGKRHFGILKEKFPKAKFYKCDIVDGFYKIEDVKSFPFDLVVICSPSSCHIDNAIQFKNAKSFFIEKPLDGDVEKMEKNLDFFKNKKTMVGCNLMFSKHTSELKKYLPICSFANIRAHTFLPEWRENYKELYSSQKKLSGGAMNDYFPHEGGLVYQILGEPKNIRVIKKRLCDYTVDTEDYALITFEYENRIINVEFSYLCRDKHRVSEVFLTNGERKIIDFSGGKSLPYQQTVEDIKETYRSQWDYFFWVKNPINSYEDAFKLMKMLG